MNQLLASIDASIAVSLNGWCSKEKARLLAMLIVSLRPMVTVEIGVYTGKSAIAMALAHKHIKHGQIVCIDPWSALASMEGYDDKNMEWWGTVNHEAVYQEFIANVVKFEVSPFIEIKRSKSNDVEPPHSIGVLHVDGQHTEQAVRDVERYAPNVIPNGIVIMDDTDWQNAGQFQVRAAVERLTGLGFVELCKVGTGAVFQRIK
jgi:hypothetical protein